MQNWHEIPAGVYSLVEQTPASVLLESAPAAGSSGISRLFFEPLQVLAPDSRSSLEECLHTVETEVARGRYAAGFFNYECGACLEPQAQAPGSAPSGPFAWFGIFERCYQWDHHAGRFLDEEARELTSCENVPAPNSTPAVSFTLTGEEYEKRIAVIHEYIRAGDVYQLNFTFPLRFEAPAEIAAFYRELRRRQPVDYGALIHWQPGRYVLSYSPELFFRIEPDAGGRRITTRPMKGTARRGRTTAEDSTMAAWLRADEKNRAENVMIVDLLRNDLGRLCEFGSVEARELFTVERHPTLWQMTSTITGLLRADVGVADILRALFPSGSVTGAPKIRAMQILGSLETEPRGVYTGAIGYFSQQESVWNVAIRTTEIEGPAAKMGVGSGIVIDSDPEQEYRECLLKSQFLTEAPPDFKLIETMLWSEGEYPLHDLHLDRLGDSAAYFGFICNWEAIRAQLLAAGTAFMPDPRPRKVRLLLSASGDVHIESEPIPPSGMPVRICVSRARTDAADRFYFHKTTRRPLYGRALKAAQAAGFDDVLFLNSEEQVTETALANMFVEKDGTLFTPPVECGLLAGVHRRHLLATRPDIRERILTFEDLKSADRAYVSNAVRGLREAAILFDALI